MDQRVYSPGDEWQDDVMDHTLPVFCAACICLSVFAFIEPRKCFDQVLSFCNNGTRRDDDLWMGLLTGTCFYLSLTIAEIVKSHLSKNISLFHEKGGILTFTKSRIFSPLFPR